MKIGELCEQEARLQDQQFALEEQKLHALADSCS
jgi:hypothetical protein